MATRDHESLRDGYEEAMHNGLAMHNLPAERDQGEQEAYEWARRYDEVHGQTHDEDAAREAATSWADAYYDAGEAR